MTRSNLQGTCDSVPLCGTINHLHIASVTTVSSGRLCRYKVGMQAQLKQKNLGSAFVSFVSKSWWYCPSSSTCNVAMETNSAWI